MASVHHPQPHPVDTEAPPSRRLSLNELENARQAERDNGLRILGVVAFVIVVLLLVGLYRMGGPRIEEPLPVPTTSIPAGIAGNTNRPPFVNGNCDKTCQSIIADEQRRLGVEEAPSTKE